MTEAALAAVRVLELLNYVECNLLDRYEHHLNSGRDKPSARLLANKDLLAEFGQEAGYTEEELQQILS